MTKLQQNLLETQTFEIQVWFRYVSSGEIEKDFEYHNIEAYDIQHAVDKAESIYKNKKAVPFKFVFENVEYKPTGLTKADLFHLTAPHYENY